MKKVLERDRKLILSASEKRAVKAERIRVAEADPFGWIAFSETDETEFYHLYCDPQTKRLQCVCADYIFRGERDANFECKHATAVLKFIARRYLANEYEAQPLDRQVLALNV